MNDDFNFFRGVLNAFWIALGCASFVAMALWVAERMT